MKNLSRKKIQIYKCYLKKYIILKIQLKIYNINAKLELNKIS